VALVVQCTQSVAASIAAATGSELEATLTSAMRRTDPDVVRVHVHEDGVFVEYADRAVRYGRVEVKVLDA
jgi:hypothetical protein